MEKPLNIDINFREFIREFHSKKPIDIHTRVLIIVLIRLLLEKEKYIEVEKAINMCRSIIYKLENKPYHEMSDINRKSSSKLFNEVIDYTRKIKNDIIME